MSRFNIRRVCRIGRLLLGVAVLAAIASTISASATVRYVDVNNTSPTPPYTNWNSAAENIQDAIDAANAGDEIVVAYGVYHTGGRVVYGALTNRVAVTKPVTVRSVDGPAVTVIQGYQVPGTTNGDSAVRCVYLTNGAILIGFTLTKSATRNGGDLVKERSGGGVWCESTSAVMSNCTLSGNSGAYGGGAYSGTLNNCRLDGNLASWNGGGAFNSILNNCTLNGNFSSIYGGGACACTLKNCTLTSNSAFWNGGGAYGGTLTNCTLSGNSAGYGGAAAGGMLNNCTLAGNLAGFGGGASYCTVNNCLLTGNTATTNGGGAYYGTLMNCTLSNNSAYLRGGGAYYGTLNNCTLSNNSAYECGGGACYGTLNNCTLNNNSVTQYGGGASGSTLNNCSLTGNSAMDAGGGASSCTLNNCTLTGNWAKNYGGGVLGNTLNSCIVYYNDVSDHITGPNYMYGIMNYCCTTPLASSGTNNFTSAPLFVDLAGGDLRLQINSPCINAGNNAFAVGTTDLAGRARIVGGTVDVGAYEFQGVHLNVATTGGGSVTRDPDLPDYVLGSLVTVTATPAIGYGFIRWTGDAAGSSNPLTLIMDTVKDITAIFASTALTLDSQGVGTFSKVPDQPFYAVGQQVTAASTAGRWHVFSGWTDGVSNNPRVFTIGESNRYTAVFTPITPLETVTIGGVSRLAPVGMSAVVVDGAFILVESVSTRGSATVTLSTTFPRGTLLYTLDGSEPSFASALYIGPFTVRRTGVLRTIAYNVDFTQSVNGDPVSIVLLPTLAGLTAGGGSVAIEPVAGDYFSNALALVTATPAAGWTFLHWLGDATGNNPIVSLSMIRDKNVLAVFGTPLNTAVVGGGSIVVSPASPWYPYGSQVRLIAVPATGNYLAFWANAANGKTNNPLTITVTNANPTVTAVFASLGGAQTKALTVIPNGRGEVLLSPSGNRFPLNTNVLVQATPETGQEFLGWAGDASGSENPLMVTMNSNKVITASFTVCPWLQGEGNPDLLNQEGFRLTLTGEFGAVYEIFGSTAWSGWTPLGTVTNDWGTVQFMDGAETNLPQRFYRAVQVSP